MIIKHIIELLKKDGEVYVNGLGLFKKIFHEAMTEGDQLIPPHNEVILQEDADGNGFALILALANQENMDVRAADEEVKKWTLSLKQRLQKNEKVALAGFGTFAEEDGKFSFTSEDIPFLNTEFEGMEPVAEKKRGRKKKITVAEISTAAIFNPGQPEEAPKEEPTAEEPAPTVEEPETVVTEPETATKETVVETEPVIEEPETPKVETETVVEETAVEPISAVAETTEKETVMEEKVVETEQENAQPVIEEETPETTDVEVPKPPKFRGIFLLLSILIIGLLVAGYLYRDKIMAYYHKWRDSNAVITDTIPTTPIEPIAEDTSLVIEDTSFVDTLVTAVIATPEQPEQTVVRPVMPASSNNEIPEIDFEAGKYYVIAGSFVTAGEAKMHIKQRHLESHNPVILRQSGSQRIRVCIGIFTTESEAQAYAASVNSKYWVLK